MRLTLYFLLLLTCLYSNTGFAQTEFRLGIEVRDKYTKRPLVPIVSVLAINTETELPGQMVDDAYVVKVKQGTQYQVFVAFQEYKTYRQTHTFEQGTASANGIFPFIIDLEPVNPPKTFAVANSENAGHTILVIDKTQRAIVSKAIVTVKDERTGQFITVKKNPNVGGSWQAELKESEQYTLEVSAPDYETYKSNLKIKFGEATEVSLNRIPKQEIKFVAVDALSNKPVAAQFKLTDETKESYTGNTNAEGSLFNPTVVVQKQPYSLIVSANGYRRHESKITVATPLPASTAPQIIKLSKVDVILKIKILEEQSGKPIMADLRVIDQTDKRAILNVKGTPNGQAATPLSPSRQYIIEAEAAGFMSYQQPLEKVLPMLGENSELTIKLAKIGDTFIQLSAVDAATGQRIPATFKITASQTEQTTEVKGTAASTLKHKITEPDIYHIETVASGYEPLKQDLDAEEMSVGQVFNFEAKLTANPAKAAAPPTSHLFTFKIFDAQTRKAIPSLRFKISNQDTRKAIPIKIKSTDVNVDLQFGQTYVIEADAVGYESTSLRVETSEWAKRGEYLTNISLVPVKKAPTARAKPVVNEKIFDNIKAGQSLTIEDNVYFDQSSYILRSEAHGQLNRLAAILLKNPVIKIEIVGHTDNIGDPRLNQILSEQRAKVIANYLVNQGVSEANITNRGEGQNRPIAPNDSEDNRQRNRRVQFLIK
jgi:outer membrane protein OmpA-like peptidoglycan-associated protein